MPQAAVDLIGPWHRPRGKLVAIDLSRHCTNAKLGHSSGNMLELAAGTQFLAGVRFQIGSRMIQLQSQRVPEMPPSVTGISVHRRVGGCTSCMLPNMAREFMVPATAN